MNARLKTSVHQTRQHASIKKVISCANASITAISGMMTNAWILMNAKQACTNARMLNVTILTVDTVVDVRLAIDSRKMT